MDFRHLIEPSHTPNSAFGNSFEQPQMPLSALLTISNTGNTSVKSTRSKGVRLCLQSLSRLPSKLRTTIPSSFPPNTVTKLLGHPTALHIKLQPCVLFAHMHLVLKPSEHCAQEPIRFLKPVFSREWHIFLSKLVVRGRSLYPALSWRFLCGRSPGGGARLCIPTTTTASLCYLSRESNISMLLK